MLAKTIATGLIGSVLLAGAVFAQSPTTTSDRANTASPSTQGDWRTSKVVGLNVYNDNNESIGSINDLLMDKSGNVKLAVISVGGFLGVGARLVAVPFDKLKFVNEPIAYTGVAGGPATAPGTRPPPPTTTGSATNSLASTPIYKPNPWYPDHAVFNVTKDNLNSMPAFKYTAE
jgi:sporulation protein YlmC with PRC-barrel domain